MEIRGKTALVTGGAGGIGKAAALGLLRRGAKVVLWDLNPRALESALGDLAAEGTVHGCALDITDRAQVDKTADEVRKDVGDIDILDNNAGVVYGGQFCSCPPEELLRTIEVNLNAVIWCTQASSRP